ncbi:FLYWCH-type domain-containing protein [Aphis craccivora]|uniref:FLYWCH-type domain-containing protein n=1 Tax=Aphis craccivora TaxID=307492 RepID=A0A6G0Y745_APHCR|nr:FLYWCH-type domain-containing protein [Aphis craccivora]
MVRYLYKQHNHKVRPFNEEVPLLRQTLTEKALKSGCSYFSRGIYMKEIGQYSKCCPRLHLGVEPQGSESMRHLRQKSFPATPDEIEDLHIILMTNS